MGRPVLLLALAALALPSRLGLFAGVPLNTWPEAVLLVLLVPPVVSRRLRGELAAPLGRIGTGAVAIGLALVVALKLVLLAGAPNPGFESCYRSPLAEPVSGACEASFDDPFGLSGGTRVDPELGFGFRPGPFSAARHGGILIGSGWLSDSNWNLSFFNHDRFAYYRPGEPDRDRLPFELTSRGPVEFESAGRLAIFYTGEGRVAVGRRSVVLPPAYAGLAVSELPVSAGTHELRLRFAYRRIALIPGPGEPPPRGPYATLRIQAADGPIGAAPAPAGWRLLAALVGGALLAFGIALACRWAWLLREYAPVALGLGVAVGATRPLEGSVDLGPLGSYGDVFWDLLALVALLGVLLARPGPRPLAFAWFAVVAVAVARTFDDFPFEDSLFYLARADPLHYTSAAHQILETGSPQGGEDVFVFQPGFRYLLFAGRGLFGATEPWLSAAALGALLLAVFIPALMLRPPDRARQLAVLAVGAALLGVVLSAPVMGVMRVNLSEWVTWALLPVATVLLLATDRPRWWAVGTTLLGIELVVRVNHAPAIAVVVLAFVLAVAPDRRRVALACCVPLAVVALLPLVHNLVYGGRFELFTTGNVGISQDPGSFATGERRGQLTDQLAHALYLDAPEGSALSSDLWRFVSLLELAWLAAAGLAVARWRRLTAAARALAALPLAALGVYAVYSPSSYYPRHVVIVFVALGLSVLYLVGRGVRDVAGRRQTTG